MPKNRKLQNIIGTEHITDAAEAAIAAQASGGATVAFKNVAVSGQDTVVADAATDTLNIAGGSNITVTTNASTDTVTIAATGGSPGGSNHQIQFNNGGSFGGDANFTFDDTADAEKVVLEANSSETLLRITQTGEGHALVVEDSTNPDGSPFIINKFGNLGIGENAISNSYRISTDVAGNIRFGSNGFITGGRVLASSDGSVTFPRFSRLTDTDTGMYFPAADNIGFTTGGAERLRFGSAGQIGIGGANYGTAGQVLTSGGASGAVSWAAASGGGGSSYPQFATVSGTGNDYFITCALPPISYNILAFTTVTLSDDIIFSPIIMLTDTTVTELGARANSGTGNFVAAIYDSDSTNNLPQNKVANSDVTFTSPASGFNSASFSSAITLSANELYWAAVCNSSTGVNTILTSTESSGQMTTTDGSSFNRGSLRITTGTINSLPSSITQSDVQPQYSTPLIYLKEQ